MYDNIFNRWNFLEKKTNNKRPYVKYLVNPKTQGDRNLAIKILYHIYIYIYSHTIPYPWRSYIWYFWLDNCTEAVLRNKIPVSVKKIHSHLPGGRTNSKKNAQKYQHYANADDEAERKWRSSSTITPPIHDSYHSTICRSSGPRKQK